MVELELILCPKELFTCACAVQPYKVIKTVIFLVLSLEQHRERCLNYLKFTFSLRKNLTILMHIEDVAN